MPQSQPRLSRRLREYDVNEISLVRVPDIIRKVAVLKSADSPDAPELTDDDLEKVEHVLKSGSRVPPMDSMGNIIEDPNELSPDARDALQAVARTIAPLRDVITANDLMAVANRMGLANVPEDSEGVDDGSGDLGDDDSGFEGNDPDDEDNLDDDPDAEDDDEDSYEGIDDDDFGSDDDSGDDDSLDPNGDDADDTDDSTDDDVDPPQTANAAPPKAAPAQPASGIKIKKPDGVDDATHAHATKKAKGAYLAAVKQKGYKSTTGSNPPKDNQMPGQKKTPVTKSAFDWSKAKFTPEQREQLEPFLDALEESQTERDQLNTENKQLVEKTASIQDQVHALQRDGEIKQLVEKTAEFKNLEDTASLAEIAMLIPAGEQRDKYIASLAAQNERIEKVTKSGVPLDKVQGSTQSGREPDSKYHQMIKQKVEKSAGKMTVDEAEASMTDDAEGRQAYLEYRRQSLGI
jgi:hypothetical protein